MTISAPAHEGGGVAADVIAELVQQGVEPVGRLQPRQMAGPVEDFVLGPCSRRGTAPMLGP